MLRDLGGTQRASSISEIEKEDLVTKAGDGIKRSDSDSKNGSTKVELVSKILDDIDCKPQIQTSPSPKLQFYQSQTLDKHNQCSEETTTTSKYTFKTR